MALTPPDLRVGWEANDAGPAPRSALLNSPPQGSAPSEIFAAHQRWRDLVERDERKLSDLHQKEPVWFPLYKSGTHKFMPVFGGTSATWDSMIAGLLLSASESKFDRIQISNLTRWPVLDSTRVVASHARKMGIEFELISPSGSTIDLFNTRDLPTLASMIVESVRELGSGQGLRDSAREIADLIDVGNLLDPPVSLSRLSIALNVALGSIAPSGASILSRDEDRRLRDFNQSVVAKRSQTAERLDGLYGDIRELCRYELFPNRKPVHFGPSTVCARVYEVEGGQGLHAFEMGREILARALARAFAKPSRNLELLVVAGAESLSAEVLESLKGSAEQFSKQLVLFFGEITPLAQRALGSGGSDYSIFLRLPNAKDAEIAAQHFGREFTFVVNGVSIAEGRTHDWNETQGTSWTSTNSRGHNTGWGSGFGGNVSRSFADGTNASTTKGGNTSSTMTTSSARVHEYIVEPEVFQHLDDFVMLAVEGKTAVLANCDFRLRSDSRTSRFPLATA
jgi:hypothetical protein